MALFGGARLRAGILLFLGLGGASPACAAAAAATVHAAIVAPDPPLAALVRTARPGGALTREGPQTVVDLRRPPHGDAPAHGADEGRRLVLVVFN